MGRVDPAKLPIHHWEHQFHTVADMIAAGWTVITKCETCGLMMTVDLKLVAKIAGPETVLWNRKQRCRRMGCPGHVIFMAPHPYAMNRTDRLWSPPPDHRVQTIGDVAAQRRPDRPRPK